MRSYRSLEDRESKPCLTPGATRKQYVWTRTQICGDGSTADQPLIYYAQPQTTAHHLFEPE